MHLSRRLSAVGTALLLSASLMTVTSAAHATTCGSAVIVSMPLINNNTGQSSWNYGYVQLWYNYCTGNNWGRTVSLQSNTTYIDSAVYNTAHARSPWAVGSGTTITSAQIYSPNNAAGAYGDVVAGNVIYYAESDQAGANCAQDLNHGYSCKI